MHDKRNDAPSSSVTLALLKTWVSDQRARIANDRFFMAMTHFVASATQPNN